MVALVSGKNPEVILICFINKPRFCWVKLHRLSFSPAYLVLDTLEFAPIVNPLLITTFDGEMSHTIGRQPFENLVAVVQPALVKADGLYPTWKISWLKGLPHLSPLFSGRHYRTMATT